MRLHDLKFSGAAGDHTIRVYDWGDTENPEALVCVHGLTRNARDFDAIAQALSREFRVICPDIAGRGESDWLADPQCYNYETYIGDMSLVITHFGLKQVNWLGTSMGGLIGMMLASTPESPIRRLILNDIGPWIPKAALQRIAGYLLTPKAFTDLADVEAYFRDVHAPFGPLSDEEWAHLAQEDIGFPPAQRKNRASDAVPNLPQIGIVFDPIAERIGDRRVVFQAPRTVRHLASTVMGEVRPFLIRKRAERCMNVAKISLDVGKIGEGFGCQ